MKRILKKLEFIVLVFTALCMFISGVSADKGEFPEYVEISFEVGDEDILINGNFVTVEKPYVTDSGTTLVPLRVITEAFGAKVLWEEETEKITLTYPGVTIVLQIGNKIARINDHSEELLEALVLSNSSTMVPLRFISETFGAVVSYDEATEGIKIVKESAPEESTLAGTIDLPHIGDSYYGWVMDNPKNFIMSDRSFDGSYTNFADDTGNEIAIEITDTNEEVVFDEYFSMLKDSFEGFTLVKADKATDSSGNRYMHFQAKYEGEIMDIRAWILEKRIVSVTSLFVSDIDEQTKNSYFALLDTFEVAGTFNENVYDLSEEEDGYRVFDSEEYKVSFKVPADYFRSAASGGDNEFIFIRGGDTKDSYIHMSIYSKSETGSAEKLAKSDREVHFKYKNKEMSEVSEVEATDINGIPGYKYTNVTKNSAADDMTMTDMFFEVGEYVYNFSIIVYADQDMAIAEEIISSLSVSELDKNEVGTMLRNDPENVDKKIKSSSGSWSLTMPSMWRQETEAMENGVVLTNRVTGAIATLGVTYDASVNSSNAAKAFRDMVDAYAGGENITTVLQPKTIKYGKGTYYKAVLKSDYEDGCTYITACMMYRNSRVVTFILGETDVYYNGAGDEEFKAMLESLEV